MNRERLLAQLIRHEGEVLHAYADSTPERYLTIGVGRLIDERRGGGISHEESQLLLSNDVTRVQTNVAARFPWYVALDDVRQNVMLNMSFNLGVSGLERFPKMIAAIVAKNYDEAARQMLASTWHQQVGKRAEELAQMMKTGEW